MGLTDGSLTIRRDEIVDLPDLVSDIPELAGHTHPRPFVLPVILVGGSLVVKLPEVSPSAQEDGGADQFTAADVALSVAGHLQADRHVDHSPLAPDREKPPQAGGIV